MRRPTRRVPPSADPRAVLFAALLLAPFACKKDAPSAGPLPAASTSASASGEAAHLHVDPSLVQSGRVVVGKVERRAPRSERKFPGDVVSGDGGRAEVGALVTGRVAELPAFVGAKVTKGQVLALIDAPEVAHAVADVVRARARADVAQRKLQRQLDLDAQNATSKNAVDDARTEAAVANADLSAARTVLRQLGGDEPSPKVTEGGAPAPARVALRSPIAGTVVQRAATMGGAVAPDKTLFVIVSGTALVVLARIPETSGLVAKNGDTAVIVGRSTDGTDARCAAKVEGDLGVVDEATRTRALRLVPDATCTWPVPGRYVDVVFAGPLLAEAGRVVPRESIVEVHGAPVVFVQNADGSFSARAVRVKPGEGPDAVLEDGPVEGERIAIVGAILLKGELLKQELE